MVGFNQAELDNLERRELQLSILAAVIVLILSGGVALLMYPLVFVHADEGNKWTLRFAFLGFCVLSLLFAGYLLDRQRTVRQLKQQLMAELKRNLEMRDQANIELLHAIPDLNRFQDCLAMEYRRASSMNQTLSLLVVKVNVSRGNSGTNEDRATLGEAARAISRNLRPTDALYLFGPGLFGLVLPDTDTANAKRITLRVEESLRAARAKNDLTFETQIYNYPEHVQSAHELEQTISSLLPEQQPWLEGAAKH